METEGERLRLEQNSVEVSNSTITSKLSFSISNVPWMELFIWSCSTEANHCIKTSSGVTRGSYLPLQLPDTFPQNRTCRKQRIAFHSGGELIPCCHSSLAPGARCCDSTSSLLEVAPTNHNTSAWLTVSAHLSRTHTCMRNPYIFQLLFLWGPRGDWLDLIVFSHLHNFILEAECKAVHTAPRIPSFVGPGQASVWLSPHTHSSACTHLSVWPHLPGLLRQVSARVRKGESSHLCAKRKMCSTGEAMLFSPGVNMLINGTVSLSTPHLLECFTWCLAQILQAALRFHHFHPSLEWPSPCPFSSGPENTRIQTHTDLIVDDSAATRRKWLETSQY